MPLGSRRGQGEHAPDGLFRLGPLPGFEEGSAQATIRLRVVQRQQLVECRPQRVHVGAGVHQAVLALRLLRAHVAQRAQQVAGHGQLSVALALGQAEVGDPEVAAAVHQQVRRLNVAVDDPQAVRVS